MQISGTFGGEDAWVGDCPLANKFVDLFNCALVKEAKVKSYFKKMYQ